MTSTAGLRDYAGKVAVVTGGSRGLGRSMVLGLAAAGADVLVSSRKQEACEEVAALVIEDGQKRSPVLAKLEPLAGGYLALMLKCYFLHNCLSSSTFASQLSCLMASLTSPRGLGCARAVCICAIKSS